MDDAVLRLYKSPESYERMTAFYDECLAEMGADVESRYVGTRFGPTHMLTCGDDSAPPLVLVQGMAGSAVLWHQQLAELSRERFVVALDTPGQPGRSAPTPMSLYGPDYPLWLIDVLDGLEYERADFMGVSIAGWVLIRLALGAPSRVRSNVLLSPMRLARAKLDGRRWVANARRKETADDRLEDRLTVREFSGASRNRPADDRLARAMSLATREFRLGVGVGVDPESSRLARVTTAARIVATVMRPMSQRDLRAVTTPTLVVIGEHEMLYREDLARRRAALMPGGRIEVIPDAGHAAVYDRPEVTNPLILDFLREPQRVV